ncbi:MAG: DUF1674 domain-containing protein [Parvularculaceae bacterium]
MPVRKMFMGIFWSLALKRLRAYMCGRTRAFNMSRAADERARGPETTRAADGEGAKVDAMEAERRKGLPPAAVHALEEADARRRAAEKTPSPKEIGGPAGPEPTRYGDWERKGRAVDF